MFVIRQEHSRIVTIGVSKTLDIKPDNITDSQGLVQIGNWTDLQEG